MELAIRGVILYVVVVLYSANTVMSFYALKRMSRRLMSMKDKTDSGETTIKEGTLLKSTAQILGDVMFVVIIQSLFFLLLALMAV